MSLVTLGLGSPRLVLLGLWGLVPHAEPALLDVAFFFAAGGFAVDATLEGAAGRVIFDQDGIVIEELGVQTAGPAALAPTVQWPAAREGHELAVGGRTFVVRSALALDDGALTLLELAETGALGALPPATEFDADLPLFFDDFFSVAATLEGVAGRVIYDRNGYQLAYLGLAVDGPACVFRAAQWPAARDGQLLVIGAAARYRVRVARPLGDGSLVLLQLAGV